MRSILDSDQTVRIQSISLDTELRVFQFMMLAGDFANFVKLDKTIDRTILNKRFVTFEVVTNLARLIPRANDDTIDEVDAYIEWADPLLTESQEIVSTTIWNTLGSLCAMFLALGKVWMYGKNWILKIWRTYKRNVKYKRRYTEHQEFLKTIEVKQEDEKKGEVIPPEPRPRGELKNIEIAAKAIYLGGLNIAGKGTKVQLEDVATKLSTARISLSILVEIKVSAKEGITITDVNKKAFDSRSFLPGDVTLAAICTTVKWSGRVQVKNSGTEEQFHEANCFGLVVGIRNQVGHTCLTFADPSPSNISQTIVCYINTHLIRLKDSTN